MAASTSRRSRATGCVQQIAPHNCLNAQKASAKHMGNAPGGVVMQVWKNINICVF